MLSSTSGLSVEPSLMIRNVLHAKVAAAKLSVLLGTVLQRISKILGKMKTMR